MEPKVLSDEEAGEMFSDIDALAERERLHRAQMTEEDAFLTEAMGPKSDKVDREAEQLKRFNETKIEDVEADAGRILQALGIPLFGGLEQPVEVPRHPASQRASSDADVAARTAAAEMKKMESLPTTKRAYPQLGVRGLTGGSTDRLHAERLSLIHI